MSASEPGSDFIENYVNLTDEQLEVYLEGLDELAPDPAPAPASGGFDDLLNGLRLPSPSPPPPLPLPLLLPPPVPLRGAIAKRGHRRHLAQRSHRKRVEPASQRRVPEYDGNICRKVRKRSLIRGSEN